MGCNKSNQQIKAVKELGEGFFNIKDQQKILEDFTKDKKWKPQYLKIIEVINSYGLAITNVIGEGSYGLVVSVKSQYNAIHAVKIQLKNNKEIFENEVQNMQKINHQNVVKYIQSISQQDMFFILMEQCSSNLKEYYQSQVKIAIPTILKHWDQLISGMEVIHSHNIIIQDLKLENLLISQDVIKYCDFGISKAVNGTNISSSFQFQGNCNHYPPEITQILLSIKNKDIQRYCQEKNIMQDKAGDVWALGIIMLEILGVDSYTISQLFQFQEEIVFPDQNKDLFEFAVYILQREKGKRPTIEQIRQQFNLLYAKYMITQVRVANQGKFQYHHQLDSMSCDFPPQQEKQLSKIDKQYSSLKELSNQNIGFKNINEAQNEIKSQQQKDQFLPQFDDMNISYNQESIVDDQESRIFNSSNKLIKIQENDYLENQNKQNIVIQVLKMDDKLQQQQQQQQYFDKEVQFAEGIVNPEQNQQ